MWGLPMFVGCGTMTVIAVQCGTLIIEEDMIKETYEAPVMEALGSFEALTQAASDGSALDAAFANNTPVDQLTFS